MSGALSYFEKVWKDHVITDLGENSFLIHIDRHFLHELSGAMAFKGLEAANRKVEYPQLTFCTLDHVLDTTPGRDDTTLIPNGNDFINRFRKGCREFDIPLFDLDDDRQGIVHVIAPALGIALPGTTLVCGDSHTCTVGGVGAFAWGIGSSDCEHVFATQTLILTKPKTMRINFNGDMAEGVYAKDLILYLIGLHTADGGNGYAIEFAGPVVRSMPVEGRLTMCNMAIEFSARTGLVQPDDVTYDYLHGAPFSPKGNAWDKAVSYWRSLQTDDETIFDKEIDIDCNEITPQVTWGTSPEHVIGIDGIVPDPDSAKTSRARSTMEKALAYSKLSPGDKVEDLSIDAAFIGSCTNSRISDLRIAADILKGRKVAEGVKAICTPGSTQVKKQAEDEGIAKILIDAGFEWRESGCSLCMSASAGGETFGKNQRVISSTNRNFENRQGLGTISHLASPATVAWSAVQGKIADARRIPQ